MLGCRTLFEMMSTEGWIDVMNGGIDGISPDKDGLPMQPKLNNSALPVGYFVVFMVFGSQFILNLFVGVIMDNFNKIKEKEEWEVSSSPMTKMLDRRPEAWNGQNSLEEDRSS